LEEEECDEPFAFSTQDDFAQELSATPDKAPSSPNPVMPHGAAPLPATSVPPSISFKDWNEITADIARAGEKLQPDQQAIGLGMAIHLQEALVKGTLSDPSIAQSYWSYSNWFAHGCTNLFPSSQSNSVGGVNLMQVAQPCNDRSGRVKSRRLQSNVEKVLHSAKPRSRTCGFCGASTGHQNKKSCPR
jgi:hypothetical protein